MSVSKIGPVGGRLVRRDGSHASLSHDLAEVDSLLPQVLCNLGGVSKFDYFPFGVWESA